MKSLMNVQFWVIMFFIAGAVARNIPANIPDEYFSWQNDKFYIHQTNNTNAKWNGKPVVVFVHGIRSNTAMCWGISPDVNVAVVNSWKTSIQQLVVDASSDQGYCSIADNQLFVQNWINELEPWKDAGIYYRGLCTQCNNGTAAGNTYCANARNYLFDIVNACCKLQAIHGKHPGPFFVHDARTLQTNYTYVSANGQQIMETFKASSVLKNGTIYYFQGTIQIPVGSVYNDNTPQGAVNASQGILSWVAQQYGRIDPTNYLNGIEFIDFFNPRWSMDEYKETPNPLTGQNANSRYLDNWQFNTPYGWNGQMILQTIEILEKYWPGGAWKNNPNAKLIFVCHSAGGLAARTMVKDLSDANWVNGFIGDFRSSELYTGYYKQMIYNSSTNSDFIDVRYNIGKIITFATPHMGGDGSWVNGLNNYIGSIDAEDPLNYSTDVIGLTILPLYNAVRGILTGLGTIFGNTCDNVNQEFDILDVLDDLRNDSYYIQRIYDNFPLDPSNNPIPVVCFTFDGDQWGANGLLSRAITPATLSKYQNYLKEFTISSFAGQGNDVHGNSVKLYWDPTNFKAAFDFSNITPDWTPPASSINRSGGLNSPR